MIEVTNNRSADAGILGFTYQFLQTALKILEADDLDTLFTVEGIEDLDISTVKDEELIQYKYHDAQKFTLSSIQKPIALMFKHFIENYSGEEEWNVKYTLFCYFGQNKSELQTSSNLITTSIELNAVLNYAEAKKILNEAKWSRELEDTFLKHLNFSKANSFEEANVRLINTLKTEFNVSETEVKVGYFSNAIYYVNQLAINKDVNLRKITKKKFVDYLSTNFMKTEFAIIKRIYGKDRYITDLKQYLAAKNIKPNTKLHIFHFPKITSYSSRFILDLVSRFSIKGKMHDTKPITLIFNSDNNQMKNLKKDLSKNTVSENLDLIFNDGNEEFFFNYRYFNNPPLISLQKNGQRIESMSYNYRLISFSTYQLNQKHILFDNPIHIFFDDIHEKYDLDEYSFSNKIIINDLEENDILRLFGS